MNLSEACSILEIPNGSTPDEAKKKFRQLSKKYHPDVNKEPGADEKFKKINEAYQVVSSGKSNDPQPAFDPFNPFQQYRQPIQAENIIISTTISFKESVLGCKKKIKFNRQSKCKVCNGQGRQRINNGCDTCGGKGQVVIQQGMSVMISTCNKCYGRSETKECQTCNSQGVLGTESTVDVSVPPGIHNGNMLRMVNMGNYSGSFGPIDQHTDVLLQIQVTPEEGLRIVDKDVVSKVQLSLLEALKGCSKNVKTINGNKKIEIIPKSRNRDEVIIPHLGVEGKGNHRVILDVQYPDDIDQLIEVLSSELHSLVT